MEDNSGFFTAPTVLMKDDYQTRKLIYDSQNGLYKIYRVDRSGRFRALKCLKPEYRGNPIYENLLRKEFEISYSLDHPNICESYSYLFVEGLGNCIEMEWIDGRSLETVLENPKISKEEMEHILDGICDALTYIHTKQIIHRDLKPSNILVTYKGNNARLIDFGFSDSDAHSILKSPAGTVSYTAPEILKGGEADARSDIYSLGLIMLRMTRKYHRIAAKCCNVHPIKRYSSALEVKKAIHSNMPIVSGVLFIAIVTAVTIYSLLGGQSKEIDSVAVSNQSPVDTFTTSPLPVAPSTPPASQASSPTEHKKETEESVDTSVIDEIFRQATHLFD